MALPAAETIVESTSTSLFNVVQNVWGLAIVCFTVMLAKVARHVNLHRMGERVGRLRADFRNNLCILLSKVSALASGRQQRELRKVRYFLKSELRR
jgi:hypothetical protein